MWKHQLIITNTMCGNIVTNKTAMCVNKILTINHNTIIAYHPPKAVNCKAFDYKGSNLVILALRQVERTSYPGK